MKGFNFNKALGMLDVFPNQKRAVICVFAIGMFLCQMSFKYFGMGHVFTPGEWASVVTLFMVAFQLKLAREESAQDEKDKE